MPALLRYLTLVCVGIILLQESALASSTPAVITTRRADNGRWELLRDGEPFTIRGVGGWRHMELAKAVGATTIRTWGIETLERETGGKRLIDRADELGLSILAGIWIKHPRHSADYGDPVFLAAQREEVRAAVRSYRRHPALLAWGLGNETELGADITDLRLWRELEVLARLIKEEDPHHPIVLVIAGADLAKIRAVRAHCPSVDIIGINSYGSAPLATQALDEAGWTKPFMLTEFGPRGHWESPLTSWGAPIEPFTAEKLAQYVGAHRAALADPQGRCLGTFCFTWGQKQETTSTWFSMFLPTGEKTPLVDAMAHEFTGRWPANRSPIPLVPRKVMIPFAFDRVPPGIEIEVSVAAFDAEGDSLTYEWIVVAETTKRRSGGDAEDVPVSFPECTVSSDGPRAVIRTPAKPGPYRLFLYVRDGHGGGTADNIPFLVQ